MNPKLSHATVRPAAQARSLIADAALAILLTPIIANCGDEEGTSQDPATATATFAWPTGPHPRAVFHIENRGTILVEL